MLEDEQKELMKQLEKEKEIKKHLEETIEECQKMLELVNYRIAFHERLIFLGDICDTLEKICDSM